MMKIYKILVLLMFLTSALFAQGLTTAAINGTITDDKGENLPFANIVAVHTPSGTQYGVSSRDDGRYDLSYPGVDRQIQEGRVLAGHYNRCSL